MADLLFKRVLLVICALLFISTSAYSYESSFPFPFEFGHSSDIYLNVQKETKQTRQENQAAFELLKQKNISTKPDDFVKYIKNNNIGAVRMLLNAGFDPNSNINTNFPLYFAAKYNRPYIINLLLEKGADPNKDMTSPARFTILNKDYASTYVLIDNGGNVNYNDMFYNETLLYTALKKKQYDIAMMLLDKGAKIDKKSYTLIKKQNLESKLGIVVGN